MNCLIATLTAAFVALAGLGIKVGSQKPLTRDMVNLTRDMVHDCNDACYKVAILNGIDSAEALCGKHGLNKPFSHAYEKCAKPEDIDRTKSEATKIVNDFTDPLDAEVSNEINSRESYCHSEVDSMVADILRSRAMEHGLNLSSARSDFFSKEDGSFITETANRGPWPVSAKLDGYSYYLYITLHFLGQVVNKDSTPWLLKKLGLVEPGMDNWKTPYDCKWLTQAGHDCSSYGPGPRCTVLPFCEANKNVPGCEQFLDIYGNCEKILGYIR